MTRILEKLLKKEVRFKWTGEEEQSFQRIKRAFDDAETLCLIRPNLEYGLETDASCVGLGARLYQFQRANPEERFTLAYASRSLKPAEFNYTTTEQEGLALAWALNKFRIILAGRTVHVSTDHRSLTFLGTCAMSSRRIARWMELFAQFDLKLRHIPGAKNTTADQLSRQPAAVVDGKPEKSSVSEDSFERELAALDLLPEEEGDITEWPEWIIQEQKNDPSTSALLREYPRLYLKRQGILRKRDLENFTDKVYIPNAMAWEFLKKVHLFLLHFGTDKVVHFVGRYFVVNNLDRLVRDVVASCATCLASKFYTRPTVGDQYYDLPQDTGLVTSIDLFGPLPRSYRGNKYVLVLTDLFSKHTALYPLRNQKVNAIIEAIENHYIPRRGFVPEALLTDRGGQFLTLKWKQFAARIGTQLKKTSPYNPQANPVERVMRELGRVLCSYAWEDHEDWDQIIPRLETVINHVAHTSTGYPPVALELDYRWYSPGKGIHINTEQKFKLPPKLLPLHQQSFKRRVAPDPETPQSRELARQESRVSLQRSAAKRKTQANKKGIAENFRVGDLVWRRTQKRSDALHRKIKKLFPVYEGPLRVISSPHPNSHELNWLDGRHAGISNLRQLRPHRESLLRPGEPERHPLTPISEISIESEKEPFIAVIENKDSESGSSLSEQFRQLPADHQPWSRLKRTQTHLDLSKCLKEKTEGKIPKRRKVRPLNSVTPSESIAEGEKPTLFDLRIVEDIAWFLQNWRRALIRHKRRKKTERRQEEGDSDFTVSTLSSGSYSTRLQSEIDQAIQGYDRALSFHQRYSPFQTTPNSFKIENRSNRKRRLPFSGYSSEMDSIGEQQLKSIKSMTQLREIRQYWLQRKQDSILRQEAARKKLIDEILKLRQETWDEEKKEKNISPNSAIIENEDSIRDRPEGKRSSCSPVPQQATTSDTPPRLSMQKTRDLSTPSGASEEMPIRCPLLELQEQLEKENTSWRRSKLSEANELREQPDGVELSKPGPSRSTQSRKSMLDWTSDSSEENIPPAQLNTLETTPAYRRRQRFNDPQDPTSRLRNPHTGRFISKANRLLIGPPGKKARPGYLPKRITTSTITSEEKMVTQKTNQQTVFERLGPKIVSQVVLSESDKIVFRNDKERQSNEFNRPSSA